MSTGNHRLSRPSRRDALRAGLFGGAGLILGGILGGRTWAGAAELAKAPMPTRAPARSVIQIWMWGGPSQLDTFDPKPEAGSAYTGPLDKPIATNIPGIRIGQLLPKLAGQADKYSIIRSMTHGINAHETAAYLMQTGHRPGRIVCPSVGAVVSKLRGYDAGYTGVAPPYIVLTNPQGRFSESGCLGNKYKPFCTGGDPNQPRFAVEGIVAQGITDQRQQARRKLLGDLDTLGKAAGSNAAFTQFDAAGEEAYAMMFGEARVLFDLNAEADTLRDAYGRNTFGQSCLMARRLVEAGVPYITINYNGWDTHKQHFQTMQRKLPEMDQAMAMLLQDLSDRGLLASTIVWWGGEFGRSPKVQNEPPWNGGRNHFGRCFSVVLAGGGFAGGKVVGESDARGETVKSRPVYPRDLIGSIYQRMGIDPSGPMPAPGIDLTLLPPPQEDEAGGGLLKEIMPA
jgi:hypothetical protein